MSSTRLAGEEVPRSPQGVGRYVTARGVRGSAARCAGDDLERSLRRIRAFWYPPYDGATI